VTGNARNEQSTYDTKELNMELQPTSRSERSVATSGIAWWKRGLDLSLLLILLPGILVVGGLVALIVRLGSAGPVFFRQKRVGYKGKEFVCLKFRTMHVNAETDSHRQHARELIKSQSPMVKLDQSHDPRVVPLGRLLRACGLDELPQLINVLEGEMSLVGPRPCIRYECEAYEPWHWQRFDAAPGLTGLWQVSGKNRTTFDEMVRLDIEYAQRQSLWLDLQIIARTLPALCQQYSDLHGSSRTEPAPQIANTLESFSS
jgi:lipopolysaccharide/colanic/teichoic acid biosynthesis glycosyltransferase